MPRPLSEQIVVLTGASSGIGRETAVSLGRRGATVVLAARGGDGLEAAARAVEAAGGKATVVPTDMADREQVDRLAAEAVRRFGRIDTWVNDHGVSSYAPADELPIEEIEQVIRVNLLGAIYGMKAAVPVMKRHGGGTIVNVASVLGKFSVPLQAAYCASKHGLIGFADALRLDLKRANANIDVVTVMPSSIDTPFFDHARARLGGHMPQPLPPAYDPAAVAHAITHVCERPQRDVVVGGAGRLFILMNRLSPWLLDQFLLFNDSGADLQTADRPKVGGDNLFAGANRPEPARGGWGDKPWAVGDSFYTRWVALGSPAKTAVAGAAVLGAAGLLGWLASGGVQPRRPQTAAPRAVAYSG